MAKKKCPPCRKRKQGKCKSKKPDGTACPGGTCRGGSCSTAAGGNSCPDGQRLCGTECLLPGQCCTDTDCPTGVTCCDHLCTDTRSDPHHCGDCATTCPAILACAGGRRCAARQGLDCTATTVCCGTDVCNDAPGPRRCVACMPAAGDCYYTSCCPNLFCVYRSATGMTCVSCKVAEESCQSAACCQGLFCQNGTCAEPGPTS